jgi:hypothetical protein
MKIAIVFSGYPRFVQECYSNISENLLSQIKEYDIYARFQWSEDSVGKRIHHEFDSVFEKDETEKFKELYKEKIKKIEIIEPIKYDTSWYNVHSIELPWLGIDECKDLIYRLKCQYKCLEDTVKMIDSPEEYSHIIRIRTDITFSQKVSVEELLQDHISVQNGYVAGFDRRFSDWFISCPTKHKSFFTDLANLEEHFSTGVLHMHNLMNKLSTKYPMLDKQFNAETPSTTKTYNFFKK